MALLIDCPKCNRSFGVSASSSKYMCDDCDGTNAAKQREEERWAALPIEAKVEELRTRMKDAEQRLSWDGRIG